MLVPEIVVPPPDAFEGYIKEKDLGDFTKPVRKILIAMSINDQWSDWQTQTIINLWGHVRQLDAELARRKLALAKLEASEKKRKRVVEVLKWVWLTLVAALLGGIGKAASEWLFK